MSLQNFFITNNLAHKLSCTITTPKENSENLVIILPGFLDTHLYPHIQELLKELGANGYMAASFDPTGTQKSAGDIKEYTVTQYIKDLDLLIFNLKTKFPQIKKVSLIGHSLGGMISMIYSQSNNDITAVCAIMAPQRTVRPENYIDRAIKWRLYGSHKFHISKVDDLKEKIEIEVPYSFIKDSLKYDVIKNIKNYENPLLLISSKSDKLVSYKEIKMTYRRTNRPKKLITFRNIEHNYLYNADHISLINKRILSFLNKNLK